MKGILRSRLSLQSILKTIRLVDTLKQSLVHADKYGCHPIYRRDLEERLEVAQWHLSQAVQ